MKIRHRAAGSLQYRGATGHRAARGHVSGAPSKNYLLMAHPFSNLPTCHTASHDPDAVRAALARLVDAVPALTPRLFLRTPTVVHYGN